MKAHILLVEDDERLAELTAEYLRKNDLTVDIEGNGHVAEARILNEKPDLVVLDIMLPGKDGLEICRNVRPQYSGVILFLTARDEDFDQILGLELGADDYISKPVQPRVLLARIKALLRRMPSAASASTSEAVYVGQERKSLQFGQFSISQTTRTALLNQEQIDLTTAEFDLLWLLARHAGTVLSRDDLLQELRGAVSPSIDLRANTLITRSVLTRDYRQRSLNCRRRKEIYCEQAFYQGRSCRGRNRRASIGRSGWHVHRDRDSHADCDEPVLSYRRHGKSWDLYGQSDVGGCCERCW